MEVKNQTYLRKLNQRAVMALLRKESALSYTDIARALKLSNTAISKICDELIEKNILIRTSHAENAKGRPPIVLRINPQAGLIAVIDFSTESTLICLSDLSGRVLGRRTLKPAFIITESTLFEVVEAVNELLSLDSAVGIELLEIYIASPGKIEESTGRFLEAYRFANAEELNLPGFFADRYHCHVSVKNDVKLSIEGELQFGKLSIETRHALMMYVDAGVGSALLLNGKIYEGTHGFAGEIENFICDIQNDNRMENLSYSLTLPGMVKKLNKELSATDSPLLTPRLNGREATFADLLEGYQKEDALCVSVVNQSACILANLIFNLSEFLNIETVILNGGIIAFGKPFLEQVNEYLRRKNKVTVTEVCYSNLKERAAIVGALILGKIEAQEGLMQRL